MYPADSQIESPFFVQLFVKMDPRLQPTREVPFISSVHGAERRTQRNISKRDLKAAVKYGTCERGYPRPKTGEGTWKYNFANITYIVADSGIEVTSYVDPLPLESVPITPRMHQQYIEASNRIAANPELITSHTMLVVDKSASMRASDVDGHRTRARGAYYVLAEEFVSKQLYPKNTDLLGGNKHHHTDVVSLVEMRGDATVVFYRKPWSWILYNDLVECAAKSDFMNSDCCGHGNYYESLKKALELLAAGAHDMTRSLFFLTDGRPSDHTPQPGRMPLWTTDRLIGLLRSFAAKHKEHFIFHAQGLGSAEVFEVLESMVRVVTAMGSIAKFGSGGRDLIALCDSLTSVVTSTTTLTSRMSSLDFKPERRAKASVEKEEYSATTEFVASQWNIYQRSRLAGTEVNRLHLHSRQRASYWSEHGFQSANAKGFAVKKKIFAEGAERIVFEMTEVNAAGQPVGIPLVAKISKYVIRDPTQSQTFHNVCLKTQNEAARLARVFNNTLNNTLQNTPLGVLALLRL